MTVVQITALETVLGSPTPVKSGTVIVDYWAGNRPYTGVDAENVVFPSTIRVAIADGELTEPLDLRPTGGVCCARIIITVPGLPSLARFVEIPAVGPVAFGDLVQVDPITYLPVEPGGTVAGTIQTEVIAYLNENPPEQGEPGDSAYQVAVENGFIGDEAAWLASLHGTDGEDGPANSLSIGSVTTLPSGQPATAQITGAPPAQTLDLGIPTGPAGAPGNPTAFELRGTGSPEGVVTAAVGTYYTDSASTNGAVRWVKASGAGNTGWRVVYGDTGWRNVSSLVTGLTAGRILLRRVNHEVFLVADAFSTATVGQNFLFPQGFEYGSDAVNAIIGIPNGTNIRLLGNFVVGGSPRTALDVQGTQNQAKWQAVFIARNDWPTALPGIPA